MTYLPYIRHIIQPNTIFNNNLIKFTQEVEIHPALQRHWLTWIGNSQRLYYIRPQRVNERQSEGETTLNKAGDAWRKWPRTNRGGGTVLLM